MLVCKNCNSTNELYSETCSSCKMPGMLVKDNTVSLQKKEEKIKDNCCINCGENNEVEAVNCKTCRFPMPIANKERHNKKAI